jgi:plastocyanin
LKPVLGEAERLSRGSLERAIPVIGCIYSGVFAIFVSTFESPPISGSNPYPLIADALGAVLLAAGFLIWRGGRIGYAIAIPMSVIFLLLFGGDLESALTGFSDYSTFIQSMVFVPVLILTLVFSVLGIRAWGKGKVQWKPRMIPASSTLALFVIGFVVGGSLIGGLAAGLESRLLANSNIVGDITIVQGASSNYNSGLTFSPPTFTVKVGTTVTWVNKDTVIHTATSNGSSLFDSGNLPTGAVFKFTFTQQGTYQYYCTLHPFMRGTIVVTA